MIPQNPEAAKKLESIFAEIFKGDAGQTALSHLCVQFGVDQRSFLPDAAKTVDPWRAGIRDGEKAAVLHILKLVARGRGEKTITIPVTQ